MTYGSHKLSKWRQKLSGVQTGRTQLGEHCVHKCDDNVIPEHTLHAFTINVMIIHLLGLTTDFTLDGQLTVLALTLWTEVSLITRHGSLSFLIQVTENTEIIIEIIIYIIIYIILQNKVIFIHLEVWIAQK